MQALSPPDREALRRKLLTMSVQERRDLLAQPPQ
jgi:hypothetical protein